MPPEQRTPGSPTSAGDSRTLGAIEEAQRVAPWPEVAAAAASLVRDELNVAAESLSDLGQRVFGLHSGFFYMPLAQLRQWGVRDVQLSQYLAVTMALGHAHFAIQDALIDRGVARPDLILASDACVLLYLDRLVTLATDLGLSNPKRFLDLHRRYYRVYTAAVLAQERHRDSVRSYSAKELFRIGDRGAPIFTVMHLVADASGRSQAGSALGISVRWMCTGLQMHDDLDDLREDYAIGLLGPAATLACEQLVAKTSAAAIPGVDNVEEVVYLGGVARNCLTVARHCFHRSYETALAVGARFLADLAVHWAVTTDDRLETLKRSVSG